MTPQPSQSDAQASVLALIVVMAAIAALSSRLGVTPFVAILCAVIAMLGTWRLLASQGAAASAETATPARTASPTSTAPLANTASPATTASRGVRRAASPTSAPSAGSAGDEIAFAPMADEGVRAVPTSPAAGSAAIGAAALGTAGLVGAVKPMEGGPASETAPAPQDVPQSDGSPAPEALEIDDIGWLPEDKPDSLGGAGRLPDGAQALAIDPPQQWSSTASGAFSLGRFEVRGASRIGTDHALLDEDRQDDFVVARAGGNKFLIVVLANGVRTAENAHLGAHWATRLLARNIELHLRDGVPGIEKMLDRTRTDLQGAFDEHFDDDTKLRTIATRLVGLIAPVDGGPAAGFRVGDGELLIEGPLGWSSVFGEAPPAEANMVFPRVSRAEVVSVDCTQGTLLLAGDGVHVPLAEDEQLAAAFASRCRHPLTEEEFGQLLDFDMDSARDDRTAVGVWFTQI